MLWLLMARGVDTDFMLCVEEVLSARLRGMEWPPLAGREIQSKTPGTQGKRQRTAHGTTAAHGSATASPRLPTMSVYPASALAPRTASSAPAPTCPGWIWILSSLWPASSKSNEDMSVR